MRQRMLLMASVVAGVAAASIGTAAAESMRNEMDSGMVRSRISQPPNDRPAMRGQMSGMMCPMMHSGIMQEGMTGSGMGRMGGESSGFFGSRATPTMNLSVEDVRAYLSSQLERLKNKRLKIGGINSADGTITADIVTVDNSLVQRLKVDPHSGVITYEN